MQALHIVSTKLLLLLVFLYRIIFPGRYGHDWKNPIGNFRDK